MCSVNSRGVSVIMPGVLDRKDEHDNETVFQDAMPFPAIFPSNKCLVGGVIYPLSSRQPGSKKMALLSTESHAMPLLQNLPFCYS